MAQKPFARDSCSGSQTFPPKPNIFVELRSPQAAAHRILQHLYSAQAHGSPCSNTTHKMLAGRQIAQSAQQQCWAASSRAVAPFQRARMTAAKAANGTSQRKACAGSQQLWN